MPSVATLLAADDGQKGPLDRARVARRTLGNDRYGHLASNSIRRFGEI